MEFHLSSLAIFLVLTFGAMASHAWTSSTMSPAMYWNKALPNTPMPTLIKQMLDPRPDMPRSADKEAILVTLSESCGVYQYNNNYSPDQVKQYSQTVGQTFFLSNHMTPGSTLNLKWTQIDKSAHGITFLPRGVSDSIPFSSEKLPEILKRLSIDPSSKVAEFMGDTLRDCEQEDHSNGAEHKSCVTSLENMISFSTNMLGTNDVRARASVSSGASSFDGKTEFKIVGVKKEEEFGSSIVVCHPHPYPYAVFFCHKTRMTGAYTVSLVGGGMKVKALAVCHGDSSWWNPKTMALQLVKAKPGSAIPVCHVLEEGMLLWTKK